MREAGESCITPPRGLMRHFFCVDYQKMYGYFEYKSQNIGLNKSAGGRTCEMHVFIKGQSPVSKGLDSAAQHKRT